VQNSAVYRCCRECLLLGVSGKPLPHCPRAACNATGVKVGGRCHASGSTLEPHYVVVEHGLFAVKFKKRAKRGGGGGRGARGAQAPSRGGGGGEGGGGADAAAAAAQG
jgi:hypothetical protein